MIKKISIYTYSTSLSMNVYILYRFYYLGKHSNNSENNNEIFPKKKNNNMFTHNIICNTFLWQIFITDVNRKIYCHV